MDKNRLILYSLITVMIFGGLYLFYYMPLSDQNEENKKNQSPDTYIIKSAETIPFDYYQDIEIGENYIYNVTSFGADTTWINFTEDTTDWKTDAGGQIFVNFTGFFNRDPDDDQGDTFPDVDMPWINISIFQSGSLLNYTNANVSNSEVSRNLKLGFADFQPGLLITVNHTDWIKANATLEANGASDLKADLTMEETYNFLYFRFQEIGGLNQKTELIYDRMTGLLVRANTTVNNFQIAIFLEDYALSFEREYVYDIIEFGPPGYGFYYDLWFTYIDTYALRTGSWIKINFTGYYNRDPLGEPWPGYSPYDEFYDSSPKRAWLDIKAVYNGVVSPIVTMSLNNRSNQEASVAFLLGLGPFVSGFLLPSVNNQSYDMKLHAENGASSIGNTLIYTETDLTIKIDSKHTASSYFPQDTCLIYEKYTGLLLWADTSIENYYLKMEIENYNLPQDSQTTISSDDDDDDDDSSKSQGISSFPLIILFSLISIASLILIFRMKKNFEIKPKL
jgi:hypothetical protein